MQVAYFYMISSDRGINDLDINFTERYTFKTSYNENEKSAEVIVSETENYKNHYVFDRFPYISRVDLIVGENGIGKTTILECLNNSSDEFDWFALLYDDKKWFLYKSYDNEDLNVTIKGDTIKGKYILPVVDSFDAFRTRFIGNSLVPEWVYKYQYKAPNEYINTALCVFDFLMDENARFEEFIPVNRICYGFALELHFTDWRTKKAKEIEKLGNNEILIIQKVTEILKAKWNAKPINLDLKTNNEKTPKWYDEFNWTVTNFMTSLFYRQIDCKNDAIINILLILLQLDWIVSCSISGDGIKAEQVDMCCEGVNIKNIQGLLIGLKNVLNKMMDKNLFKGSIITEYVKSNFIALMRDSMKSQYYIIEIHNSAKINFIVHLYELNDLKGTKLLAESIVDIRQRIALICKLSEKVHKNQMIRDTYGLKQVGYCNVSTGEIEFLNLFARIYEGISFLMPEEKSTKNILLLLDEPDISFHPEWSRRLTYKLLQIVNYLFEIYEYKGQVIIATHSPFMVSDFPTNCVTCISYDDKNEQLNKRKSYKIANSFAANIYDLLNDGFYMNAPVGELAKLTIQQVLDNINNLDSLDKNNEKLRYIETILALISDKLVKGKITDLYKQQKEKLKSLDEISENKIIMMLQNEIIDLKKDLDSLKKRVDDNDSN